VRRSEQNLLKKPRNCFFRGKKYACQILRLFYGSLALLSFFSACREVSYLLMRKQNMLYATLLEDDFRGKFQLLLDAENGLAVILQVRLLEGEVSDVEHAADDVLLKCECRAGLLELFAVC